MSEDPPKPSDDTARNVRPIHPGLAIAPPPKDPILQLFESMGMSFEHMSTERDSPKGRAWDLLCACARRAPVSEEDLGRVLDLSEKFEEMWSARQTAKQPPAMTEAELETIARERR